MTRVLRPLALALALLATPAPALAQPANTDAVAAYKRGRMLLAQKKPGQALEELKRSVELLPSPNTELLIGHALRDLERFGEAMETYERVLRDASDKVQAGEARYQRTLEEAGRWSAALRPKTGKVRVTLEGGPATVRVGEREIAELGGAREAWLAAGVATLRATADDGREVTEEVTVPGGGAAVAVTLTLPPIEVDAPPPEPVAPMPAAPPVEEGEGFPLPPWPTYVAAGVGVVGFAMFGGFGAASASTASDLDECAPSCPESLREDADAGKRNQLIANIGLGVGITGLAAAAAIWTVDIVMEDDSPFHDGEGDVAIRVGPAGAALVGRF